MKKIIIILTCSLFVAACAKSVKEHSFYSNAPSIEKSTKVENFSTPEIKPIPPQVSSEKGPIVYPEIESAKSSATEPISRLSWEELEIISKLILIEVKNDLDLTKQALSKTSTVSGINSRDIKVLNRVLDQDRETIVMLQEHLKVIDVKLKQQEIHNISFLIGILVLFILFIWKVRITK